MRRFSIFALLLVSFAALAPAPGAWAAKSTPTLKEILKNTESYYQQLNAYTAHFRQRTTSASASSITTEASGKLYYQKPRKMRWEYDTPEAQVFVANREHAWLYVPQDRQVSLFEGRSFFASPIARTFFDGIFELRKQFEVTLDARETTDKAAVLNLVPKEEDPHVQSLRLWIDLQTYRILSVETRDAIGNLNRLVIEAQKETSDMDPELFRLDVPTGTLVINPEGRELSPSDVRDLKNRIASPEENS